MPILSVDTLPAVRWERWSVPLRPPDLAVFRYQIYADDQHWLYQLMLPDEQERAKRFRQLADKQRFIGGRGWLRWLAGQLLDRSPQQIQLAIGSSGKPELVHANRQGVGWHINVSHSGDWVLLAVGDVPVGVDVEWLRPDWPYQNLIAASFTPDDQAHIRAAADPQAMFYTFWTRKESLFKATGQGLTNDFMAISVSKGVHRASAGLPEEPGTWSIRSFPVADGYVGAIACQGSPRPSRFFTLDAATAGLGNGLLYK